MKFLQGIFRGMSRDRSSYGNRKRYSDQILESKVAPCFFIELLSRYIKDEHSFITEKIFSAKGDFEFGSSKESIVKSWGQPSYSTQSKHTFQHEILLYRTIVGGQKAKYELHFVNNGLFSFSLKFSYIDGKQRNALIDTLSYKYFQNQLRLPKRPFKIFDKESNMLFVEMRTGLTINYLSGNDEQQKLVELALDVSSAKREHRKRKREMELAYCL